MCINVDVVYVEYSLYFVYECWSVCFDFKGLYDVLYRIWFYGVDFDEIRVCLSGVKIDIIGLNG